jgi:DNA-binding transcriptional LysR family regulator
VRLDRFDLNLLVVLDVLLEERNVTRASERLFIGQSATSAALSRLRDYFGDSLLVQVGRRMEPTPLAQSLAVPVRDVLMRARVAVSMRPVFDPARIECDLTIAASDYMIDLVLAEAICGLARTTPGMRLHMSGVPEDINGMFERGAIDLIVVPEQYATQIKHPQIELWQDEHVCMMCAAEAREIEALTMDEYLDRGHVAIKLGDEASLSFEEWFLPRFGRQRRVECTINQFSIAPLFVKGTQRIVTIHRRLAERMAMTHPVKLLPAPFEMQPLREFMVWPRYLDEDPAHRWLRDTITGIAKKNG